MVDNRTRNRILLVLFVGVLMGALDIAIVGPALPAIQTTFGANDRSIAWVFTIYVLFNLIGTPLMAKLSDDFGRRSIYALDVALFSAGSLLVALSPSFGVLLVGRAVQGFGAGGIFPVASAVIGDTFPPEKRGSALGLIGAVFGLAFIIGPILGGVLLIFGWPWLFLINLPIAVVLIVMSLRLLPAMPLEQRPSFDWQGMTVLAALLTSLAYGINQIDTARFLDSVTSLQVWPFLLATAVLIPLFLRIERRAADPVLRLSLFGSRQAVLASIFSAGAGLGEAGLVFMPALAVAAFGMTESAASFMLMPVVLAMTIGSPLAGRLLDRFGSKVVILSGSALLTLGMLMLSQLATHLTLFITAGAVIGLGLSALLGAPVRYIMLNEAPAADRAAAQGAITLFASVGQLMSGALVGAVAASHGGGVAGYGTAYLLVGAVALVLTLLAQGLKGRAEELATLLQNEQTSGVDTAQPAHL
ncbi:MAG: MFS transporter [Chloroflexi bacterium]|nr:MAG: MFS transporter [Chloroflexota bacterium]